MKDHGGKTEDFIEELCKKVCLRDFTARSPKYTKSGIEKEVSDILIKFKDTIINFQVKSKIEDKPFPCKDDKDKDRIIRKIEDAVEQLKTLNRAEATGTFNEIVTTQGVKIPYAPQNIKKRIGIICINLEGEDKFSEDERTELPMTYMEKHDHEVHIFLKDVFYEISKELDTIPDLLRYLDTRKTLLQNNVLIPLTSELDFLAMFKAKWPDIEDALSKAKTGNFKFVILPGMWDWYKKNCCLLAVRDKDNEVSFIIDSCIEHLYRCINYQAHPDSPIGTMEAYLEIITCLAGLNRLERRGLGERFLEKAGKSVTSERGFNYAFSIYPEQSLGILVMGFRGDDRKKRVELLDKILHCATVFYKSYNLKEIIGIATEEASQKERSYDVLLIRDYKPEEDSNYPELLDCASKIFQPPKNETIHEYREIQEKPIHSKRKIGRNSPCPCGSGKKYKKCCRQK